MHQKIEVRISCTAIKIRRPTPFAKGAACALGSSRIALARWTAIARRGVRGFCRVVVPSCLAIVVLKLGNSLQTCRKRPFLREKMLI